MRGAGGLSDRPGQPGHMGQAAFVEHMRLPGAPVIIPAGSRRAPVAPPARHRVRRHARERGDAERVAPEEVGRPRDTVATGNLRRPQSHPGKKEPAGTRKPWGKMESLLSSL
eukprot:gene9554-biopygen10199